MKEYFTEDEWFEEFYPHELGDWRKEFVVNNDSGCCWMDYCFNGFPLSSKNDILPISKCPEVNPNFIDHFFIECGNLLDENNVCWFVQPYYQKKNETYYANVVVSKLESNLDLYEIYISGHDDSSYTKHFLSKSSILDEIDYLKNYGIDNIQDREYFFTN